MKKQRVLLWLIPLVILMLLIPFIVPSALPYAGAESADLPAYAPVELANPHPDPLPMPDPKGKKDPYGYAAHEDGFVYDEATKAAWEYRDGTVYVKIDVRTIGKTKVYFTWVQIADASQLRTHCTGSQSNPLSEARKVGALLALSGDSYSMQAQALGVIIRDGVQIRAEKPFGNTDVLIIDNEGWFHILRRPEEKEFAAYYGSIMHSFVFGPALVVDGQLQAFADKNYGINVGMGKLTQRQAICQMDKLSYLIITTEGPNESRGGGFTMEQLAKLCYDMGAKNAYNLDGGNSACVVLNNVRMNRFGKGGYRPITDLIYFVSAEPAPEPTEAPMEVPTEEPAESPAASDTPAEVPAEPQPAAEGSTAP